MRPLHGRPSAADAGRRIDGSFTASVSVTNLDPKERVGAVDVVRQWKELSYLIIYITGRLDMQQRHVVSCMAQHSFPHGLLLFADGKLVCILLFYPSCPFFKFNCCNKQVAQATCPIWPRTSAGRTKSTRICCCPEAVCLCPATELLSSAEGLCVSNKFLLPVYLHDNLCVFTVTIQAITVLTGARLSFCLFIRRFIKIICYVRQANQKGDIFPDVERLLSSCKIYDDDTKVDLVFVVFFLYFSLFVSGCVCVTFVFAVVYNALWITD